MIETDAGKLYTGISTDPIRRFVEHLTGLKGAKYFRGSEPRDIVYLEEWENRSEASIREAEIKRMTRQGKEALIRG